MATVDDESEPGAWKREIEKMPWRFKHSNYATMNDVLAALRANGFLEEANFIAGEIQRYRTQIYLLEKKPNE